MPLQYVIAYLLVAMDEGKSVTDYADIAEVPLTVMTRHLLDIGDRNRARENGFGLVTQDRDAHDLRRRRARGTPQGKALMHEIKQALKTAPR